ncbi:plasmid stabilization protein [Nocardia sp. KC 131]|uniref:plasmid stabilization protein n=1 Tax=Nocardia arseniciresistens TaxID=3392119 RepID=UPI00398E89C2
MPKEWSNKDERQYKHIKDSAKDRGTNTDRAEEIAARTVNKNRARAGKTKTASRSSTEDMSAQRRGGLRSGTKGPKGPTRDQLYNEAKQRGIEGRSKMTKGQLARALGK